MFIALLMSPCLMEPSCRRLRQYIIEPIMLRRMSSSFSWRMPSPNSCLYRQKATPLQKKRPRTCTFPSPFSRSPLLVVSCHPTTSRLKHPTFPIYSLKVVLSIYTWCTCTLAFSAVEVTPKSKGFQVKEGSAELDSPKQEDVALFLHTSGTTSRPKVSKGPGL